MGLAAVLWGAGDCADVQTVKGLAAWAIQCNMIADDAKWWDISGAMSHLAGSASSAVWV